MPHIVLLLLIPRENPNLTDVCGQESSQYGVTEGTGAAGNEEDFSVE